MNATDTRPESVSHPSTSSSSSSSSSAGASGSGTSGDYRSAGTSAPYSSSGFGGHAAGRELRRSARGRMLAGVAAGAADYAGIDVNIVRILLVVFTIIGGAGIPLYLAGWLLIPEQGSDQSLGSELLQSLSAREH